MTDTQLSQRNTELESSTFDEDSSLKQTTTIQKESQDKQKTLEEWGEWLSYKLQAVLWVGGSIFLIYQSNFFEHLYSHEETNSFFFSIFMVTVGINSTIACYASLWMPYVLKLKTDFETHSPRMIYVGAVSGFTSFISLIIAIWPVFGWWSPPMVFILLMGMLNVPHFLPNNQFGSLVYGLIIIGTFFSHLLINHMGIMHNQPEDNLPQDEGQNL